MKHVKGTNDDKVGGGAHDSGACGQWQTSVRIPPANVAVVPSVVAIKMDDAGDFETKTQDKVKAAD